MMKMPIDSMWEETKHTKHVEATGVIPAESILLPPSVPKCKLLSEQSVHPHRVAITVTERSRTGPPITESRRQRVSQKQADKAVAEKGYKGHQPVPAPPQERNPPLLPQWRDRRKTPCLHFMWHPNG